MKIVYAFILFFFIPEANVSAQEYGLQLYSMREQFKTDVAGTLKKISQWNIREVEGGGTYGLPLEEYKKMLSDNKLVMVSVGANFKQLKTNPQAAIDEAQKFNAKYVVCFGIPHDGNNFEISHVKEAAQVFNAAGKKLKENGISLCYFHQKPTITFSMITYQYQYQILRFLPDRVNEEFVNLGVVVFDSEQLKFTNGLES